MAEHDGQRTPAGCTGATSEHAADTLLENKDVEDIGGSSPRANALTAGRMASYRQVGGWALLFLSYVSFYLCRKNYAFWLRSMMTEYHMSAADVGLLGSAFELSFGIGKLAGGVVVDVMNPVVVLAASLACSAVCNVALASTDSLPALAAINFVHGGFQSLGWPALATVLMLLFPSSKERGRCMLDRERATWLAGG